MAIENCNTKNPLIRDGTSQGQRQLPELHPRHARIDEHLLSDFMNFAASYGEQLQYFDSHNKTSGDWKDFFDRDVASVISIVANKDNCEYRTLFNDIKIFLNNTNSADSIINSGTFEILFNLIFQLSSEFNEWVLKAQTENGFKRHLHRLITSQLKASLSNTVTAYLYAVDTDWFGQASSTVSEFSFDAEKILRQPYSSLWNDNSNGDLYTLCDWMNSSEQDNEDFNFLSNRIY